jgi:enoyl-CoA hydratase/carnithine racemase
MQNIDSVLFTEEKGIGRITLNRQEVINELKKEKIEKI